MSQRPAYKVEWHDSAVADLRDLYTIDPRMPRIAVEAAGDLAEHHKHGKELGQRNVSGDLSGYFRLCFDVPGQRPQRYRMIYSRPAADVIRILAVGKREGSAIYRLAVKRLR